MHDTINGYSCVFETCCHRFSTLPSLRHHFKKYHNISASVEAVRENENSPRVDNTSALSADPADDAVDQGHSSEKPYRDINTEEKKSSDNIFDVGKIREEIQRMRKLFTLTWLSKDSISRNVAFDIQKDISDFVIGPIRKTIEMMFNAGMLTDTTKQLLDELLGEFDTISEHKFIQQLKAENLYHDPSFFTISEELKPAVIDNEQQMVSYF